MLGELQKFNRPVIWVNLKKYQALPSVTAARAAILPIRALLRGVGLYSMQVVALYDSPLSEERKISELARYLTEYIRPALASVDSTDVRYSTAELDKVVGNIRTSKTFLSALGAAQPVVNATVAHGNSLFDSMDGLVMAAAADVGDRVEAQYAPLKQSVAELDSMHVASLHSYALLERFRGGESVALDTLRRERCRGGRVSAGRASAGCQGSRSGGAFPDRSLDHHQGDAGSARPRCRQLPREPDRARQSPQSRPRSAPSWAA